MTTTAKLHDNTAQQRYELIDDGNLVGFAQYRGSDTAITIVHTEVDSQYEGKGYGSVLAKLALEHVRQQQKKVVPACEFIAAYITRHKEFADLLHD